MNNLISYIKNYKWQSVFFKYLKIITATILLMFLPYNFIMYSYYKDSLSKEIEKISTENIFKTTYAIDSVFDSLNKSFSVMSHDNNVSNFLMNFDNIDEGVENSSVMQNIMDLYKNTMAGNDYIKSIYLYGTNNKFMSTKAGSDGEQLAQLPWYQYYKKNKNPTFKYAYKYDNKEYLAISNAIYLYGGTLDGMIVMNIDLSEFSNIIFSNYSDSSNSFYITDNNGTILYSSQKNKSNNNIGNFNDMCSDLSTLELGKVKINRNKNIVSTFFLSPNSGLIYVSNYDEAYFTQNLRGLKIMILGGGVFCLFVGLGLAVFISLKMYNSIVDVISIIQTTESKDENDNIGLRNETNYISKRIVGMIDKNKRIDEELNKRLVMLKKSQLIALQTQINPHFIFNSLQLVNLIFMREFKCDNDATKIINLISDLLRISLDTKEMIIPLSLEVQYTKKYIDIQNIKYKNRFSICWNIEQNLLAEKTVKLILQPILENCILHGFSRNHTNPKIVVTMKMVDDNIIIYVFDNGKGICEEEIKNINNRLNQDYITENAHIGLANVNQRIKLICTDAYGISVTSKQNKFTLVKIVQPKL